MNFPKSLIFLLLLSPAIGVTSGPALAQSCAQLASDLAQMEQGGFGSPAAIPGQRHREVNARLRQAQIQANRAGCFQGGGFFFNAAPPPICGPIIATIERLENELDRMRRGQGTVLGDPYQQANANHLRRLMAERGCTEPRQAVSDDWLVDPFEDNLTNQTPAAPIYSDGPIRTMCVRTCDGYYFPISFSTTPDRLSADQQACSARCPGAPTELFFHGNPEAGTRPQDLRSLNGQRYSDLPTALKYRSALSSGCSCQGSAVQEARIPSQSSRSVLSSPAPIPDAAPGRIAGLSADDPLARTVPYDQRSIPVGQPRPVPRPATSETPEKREKVPTEASLPRTEQGPSQPDVLSTEEGSAVAIAPEIASETNETIDTVDNEGQSEPGDSKAVIGGKSVRIVGPAPWGAPKKEELLQAPVQN